MSSLPLPIAAFAAGLVSFLTPCVLPLVPGYISLISGAGLDELKQQTGRVKRSVMLSSILFVLGFSAVFLALGAVASGLGQLVRQHIAWLTKMAGVVIILLGVHQVGLLPIHALYAVKRFHADPPGTAATKAFLIGAAFGFGGHPAWGLSWQSFLRLQLPNQRWSKECRCRRCTRWDSPSRFCSPP